MNHAIILAGGAGTRFWPLSRQNRPKQFLNLCADKSLIELTVNRIGCLIPRNNIYIATNKDYQARIKKCIRRWRIPAQNIIAEPQARNTLAPIGTLSEAIYRRDKDAVILVLPSDHYIKEESKFLNILKRAVSAAKNGYIVTLGIKPDRPETGYGYIKVSSKLKAQGSGSFFRVERFIEKPDFKKADRLIKDRKHYWNGGIFIFRAETMLGEIRKFLPSDYRIIKSIKNKKDLNRLWPRFSLISIDYAIMEKTRRMALVPCDCGWSDLGSWQALEQFSKKDKSGNILKGPCLDIGSKNIFCWPGDRLLATVGLRDIIIVDTNDALLVCQKGRAQDVKKIVEKLKEKRLYKKI